MQKQGVFSCVFLGVAATVWCGLPQTVEAQSAPPGQVTHRMATSQKKGDTSVPAATIAQSMVTNAQTPPGTKNATTTVASASVTESSSAPVAPCASKTGRDLDQCRLTNAVGSASMAAWSVVVKVGGQYPVSVTKLDAARKLAALILDTTDPATAKQSAQAIRDAYAYESPRNKQAIAAKSAEIAALKAQIVQAKADKKEPDATTVANEAQDETDLVTLQNTGEGLDAANAVAIQFAAALKSDHCTTTLAPDTGGSTGKPAKYQYTYRVRFPTFGKACSGDAVKNYFNAGDPLVEAADQVKYLYNAQQSASQFSSDLLTATFPGFQAVLAGTATAGSSQPATTTATSATSSATTASFRATAVHPFATVAATSTAPTVDSVATAVSKIENGGDFNIRFPVPLLYYQHQNFSISSGTHPNVGFNIDQFSAQSTITESTEYGFNVPWEWYMQTTSLDLDANGNASAALFLDLQPSAEVISTGLANKIGLTGSRAFFLGQAATGIQFSNSIGISFQYFYGPKQALASTDASRTTTMINPRIQGFHLAISFSPQKKSKS